MINIETDFLSYTHGIPCEYELFIPDHLVNRYANNSEELIPCLWLFPPRRGNCKLWSRYIRLNSLLKSKDIIVVIFELEDNNQEQYIEELKSHIQQLYNFINPDTEHIHIYLDEDLEAAENNFIDKLRGIGLWQ